MTSADIKRYHGVTEIGATDEITQSVYMITAERKTANPWAQALSKHAQSVFSV